MTWSTSSKTTWPESLCSITKYELNLYDVLLEFLVQLYGIKCIVQAQWVPEPPVDPATLDQTFGLKDATCRPNLMRMQSKDKPPSSIGEILSYLQNQMSLNQTTIVDR